MRFVRVCSAVLFILMLPWGAPEDWGEGCRGTKTLHIRCMFECAISFAAGNGGEWCLPAKNVAGTYHQRVASSLTVQSVDDFDLTELHCRVICMCCFLNEPSGAFRSRSIKPCEMLQNFLRICALSVCLYFDLNWFALTTQNYLDSPEAYHIPSFWNDQHCWFERIFLDP